MRRLTITILLLAALAVPSGGQAASAPVSAALSCPKTVDVTVGDSGRRLFFSKDLVTLRKGQCVRWNWTGDVPHQVVTPDGVRSATRRAPYTFRRSFSRPRVKPYKIFCSVHPTMEMKVRVKPRRPA